MQVTGTVGKVDCFRKTLQIGEVVVDFSEIDEILLPD